LNGNEYLPQATSVDGPKNDQYLTKRIHRNDKFAARSNYSKINLINDYQNFTETHSSTGAHALKHLFTDTYAKVKKLTFSISMPFSPGPSPLWA
jgi:hypothetical protein